MKRAILKRVFAMLMTMAIAITAIPMMEVQAAESELDVNIDSVQWENTSITIDDSNTTASLENGVVTLSGSDVSKVKSVYVQYQHEEEYIHNGAWFEKSTEEAGKFVDGNLDVDIDMKTGTWSIVHVMLQLDDDTEVFYWAEDGNVPKSDITVYNNITDLDAPVISNLSFPKNGRTYIYGRDEELKFYADLSDGDGSGIDVNNSFVHVSNLKGENLWLNFELQSDGSYMATLSVDSVDGFLTNTEWYVESIYVYDNAGNETEYYFVENDQYWFFLIEDGGVCDNSREIVTYFYNEDNELIYTETITKAANGELELYDLLDKIPTYESELGFKNWKEGESGKILEDGQIYISTNTEEEYNFYPTFTNQIVTISTEYFLLGQWRYSMIELIVPYDINDEDLSEYIPIPNTDDGLVFEKWEYSGVVEGYAPQYTAIYDKKIVEQSSVVLAEDYSIDWDTDVLFVDKNATYNDILESLEDADDVLDCNFVKWELAYVDDVKLDDVIDDWRITWTAIYDKYPVTVERVYVDNTDEIKIEEIQKIYPAGTLMDEIVKNHKDVPADASDSALSWIADYTSGEISVLNNYAFLKADYEDEAILEIEFEYWLSKDDYGLEVEEKYYFLVDKSHCASEDSMEKYIRTEIMPNLDVKHYEQIEFDGWDFGFYESTEGQYDIAYVEAEYNKKEVIYLLLRMGEDEDYEKRYYIVEPGDIIKLPTEHAGYYLVWEGEDRQTLEAIEVTNNIFVVPNDANVGDYYVFDGEYGEKIPAQATPSEPGKEESVPDTSDITSALPYAMLLLFGVGVFMVGATKRKIY